jgi:hypothetical protein
MFDGQNIIFSKKNTVFFAESLFGILAGNITPELVENQVL